MSVNKCVLIGHCGRDPSIRYSAEGQAMTSIALATSSSWKDKATGEKREETEWHNLVFYGRLAEVAGEYLKKGMQVYVEGRLKTRKWEDKNQVTRYSTEVICDQMQMLGGKQKTEEASPSAPATQPQRTSTKANTVADMDDDCPF
jgi:single-strand DNA-binding protein